jgi:hypothetical protein
VVDFHRPEFCPAAIDDEGRPVVARTEQGGGGYLEL